ncbi:TOBE domain-containing protein [Sulfurimonas sp. SWIR-19]|uniref:TOBE domain-containing protein n=1 Tax=Sulfurimonas sp. SWIR-19 TaxID=2878390 RepID=UPI001CF49DE0|nr:TOBE domain-containing protein [Sulfurimonas sp. SWIR-19]UCN00043.1 TOBE domain-containing protein [Sulfurimonas sp. SWIR-19]
MNTITAKVAAIQTVQNLHIVHFTCNESTLGMMSLELPKTLTRNTEVLLTCKPTAIAIAKNLQGALSHANQLHVTVHSIEVGELLSVVVLQFHDDVLESIITSDSLKKMQLHVGESVIALIKSSDLSLKEILS